MLEVDKNTFQAEVLEAEGYVFVDFFGDGCVPCQALMPFVHSMADQYGDKLKFTSLNTTKARRLAIGQKILGLPVMAIYKDGEKVEELVKDDATEANIEAMIEKIHLIRKSICNFLAKKHVYLMRTKPNRHFAGV